MVQYLIWTDLHVSLEYRDATLITLYQFVIEIYERDSYLIENWSQKT